MPGTNTVLIGAQWGDEGKGKVIDVLTDRADWVVRYQGGNNAGHTVEIGGTRYVLHLVPSGIFRERTKCVIGNGLVVDPAGLLAEIAEVRAAGFGVEGRLFLGDRAHLVLPYHRALDAGRERTLSDGERIGTTQRGIGPAYVDKAQRTGLRAGAMCLPDFADMVRARVEDANARLAHQGQPVLDVAEVVSRAVAAAKELAPLVADTVDLLHGAMARGESILFEGAQGTMLDVDFGSYPFVTSSNATSGGACTGSGVPPNRIDKVIGVLKAYTTRVGEGPFPTELLDATGETLRAVGREFGATTGRPRRCGWFDAVVARYSARVNGIDAWALTKLDVLDGFDTIRVCTAYEADGRRHETVPADAGVLARCRPVYEEHPGWKAVLRGASGLADLPAAARAYVARIESLTGVPVEILSVGPGRENTIQIPAKAARG
ncbi:MAG: adenylosuccinate synthase [Lentisphaerae bacterium]|nr:adenylosuccinate synthase [Lentisphaerota bacterium]